MLTVVFGELIDAFGKSGTAHVVDEVSKKYQPGWLLERGKQLAFGVYTLEQYFGRILRAFFDTETTSGEVIGRMSGDIILIHDAMGEKVGNFIQLFATFLGGFAIAIMRGWLLALVMLSCIPPLGVAGGLMTMFLSKTSENGQIAYAEAGNVVEQTVGAIKTVASFTGEKVAAESYNRLLRKAYTSITKQALASGLGLGFVMLILYSSFGIAVWYGAKLIIEKGYSAGVVINVIISVTTGGVALRQASPCFKVFAAGQAAAYRMFEAIKREPLIDTYDKSGIVPNDIRGDIEFKDVYFSYPARPEVQIFSAFSLYVPSGTTAALVGQSGSGKSTVISLVERFYDPQAGEVIIDGIDLKRLQLKWIRQKIGLVSQEPVLFTTTIKDNIAYGKENATLEDIRVAVELANAAKFINTLPKGLDTMVGEHGTQFSGGQKQKIAIARAILKNPKILLQDEATSALDAESERIVQDALVGVMSNRTTIVVAHRLSTVRNANIIAVVQQGKIIEQGTHTELMKNSDGTYSQLIRLQDAHEQVEDIPSLDSLNPDSTIVGMTRSRNEIESEGSSNGRHSFGLSVSVGLHAIDIREDAGDEKNEEATHKVSLRRLAYMNMPELFVLLLGSIGAAVHGAISPVFGILLSKSIKIFFENPNELHKHSKFWSLEFVILGGIGLIFIPVQHYFFGVAGGKLIQRVRSMCFEKVVYQEISWFDKAENSSGAIGARLSPDASSLRGLVGDYIALLVQNFSTITVALIIAFVANWRLALVVLALLPLLGSEAYAKQKFLQGFGADAKVFFALIISAMSISQTTAMAPESNKAKDAAASIFKILDSKPKIDSNNNEGAILADLKGNIDFQHANTPRLLLLLERVVALRWLRQQTGLVSQEPILFNETIHANVVYGRLGASEEELIAATKAANAHNFISSLPQGYNTSVGERGVQLSGGQKQRIAIARAILKNLKILLLDEATSALDAESERVVQDALDRVMINKTTVVVAHLLSTIKGADVIAVVKNSMIVESGSHEELMKIANGNYASLVSLDHMSA
ncbi:Abc transporter b family member [Thalictrum thalictroides]|uniref:Abc transporter b family member n=1 Tax=Thalictrum thalictroides TaxID=46969 RepID=A0A7J6WIY2_THATH|nr:Abc transporter b family member [Thalictrum thalictroides]